MIDLCFFFLFFACCLYFVVLGERIEFGTLVEGGGVDASCVEGGWRWMNMDWTGLGFGSGDDKKKCVTD